MHNRRITDHMDPHQLREALRRLDSGVDPNAIRDGWPLLALAIAHRNLGLVEPLLIAGADPCLTTAAQETPLGLAVKEGMTTAVRYLLAYHACVDQPSGDLDWTPLLHAAYWGRCGSAKYLLEARADTNYVAPAGETALGLAIQRCHLACLRLLLRYGADPLQIQDHEPMIVHATRHCAGAVPFLLARKADPASLTKDGQALLDLARSIGDPATIAVIEQALLGKIPTPPSTPRTRSKL